MKKRIMLIGLIITIGSHSITNAQEPYVNPVDGKTYIADWKTYKAEGKTNQKEGRVSNLSVRLLSTQDDFSRNVSIEELAKLINYTQDLLLIAVKSYKEPGEILLQISLNRDKQPEFKISYQGKLDSKMLKQFFSSLKKIELKTKESTVTLQVHFNIKKK